MKKKGISIWEQHLERIVLGAAVVFLLAFGGLQVMKKPNAVEVDGQAKVPGEINAIVEEEAEALASRLSAQAPPTVELREPAPLAPRFGERLAAAVAPTDALAITRPPAALAGGADAEGGQRYVELDLPAPALPSPRVHADALVPEVVSRHASLQDRFPVDPFDIQWVTVAAVLDLDAIRAQYTQSGSDEAAAIPESWYGGRQSILDVRLERERRLADGTWGDRTVVPPLPGQLSFRAQLGLDTATAKNAVLDALAATGAQGQVMRPAFLDTVNGTWNAHDPRIEERIAAEAARELSQEERRINGLRRSLAEKIQERAGIASQIEELGGRVPERETREPERETRPSRPSNPSQPGFGGQEGSTRRDSDANRQAAPGSQIGFGSGGEAARRERELERLERRITGLDRAIARDEQALRELGVDPSADAAAAARAAAEDLAIDPLSGSEAVVHAHDIGIEAGETYRYRVVVDFYNPFFRRKLDLDEAQHELAEGMGLATRPSAWTDPVEVTPVVSVFVVAADPVGGRLGLGSARAEVFRFYYGRWWRESFNVELGERIGRADGRVRNPQPGGPTQIDFSTDLYLLDVVPRLDRSQEESEAGLGAVAILQAPEDPDRSRVDDPWRIERVGDLDYDRLAAAVDEAERRARDAAEAREAEG